ERPESCLWFSHGAITFREERQKIGPIDRCARGTKGSQALVELRHPIPGLVLLCQCPTAQQRTDCHPVRKTLCHSQADDGFGAFQGETPLAAELMAYRRTI